MVLIKSFLESSYPDFTKYKSDLGLDIVVEYAVTSRIFQPLELSLITYYYTSNQFQYSLVYVEACNGLRYTPMAEAFTSCVAGAYVGYESVINPTFPLYWWSGYENSRQAFNDFLS